MPCQRFLEVHESNASGRQQEAPGIAGTEIGAEIYMPHAGLVICLLSGHMDFRVTKERGGE